MLTIPLVRTENLKLTPMEQASLNCETIITALMTQATLADNVDPNERETFTLLMVATIIPAEA
jgi:hypothetical protein